VSTPSAGESSPAAPLDVVVVAYHSGAVLSRCLEAAHAFAPAGTRFFIVDNSPADPSANAAARPFNAAAVLPQPGNVGYASAANVGIAAGAAPFVLLLNPDVVKLEGSFDAITRIFSADERVAAVTARLRNEAGKLTRCRREFRLFDFLVPALSLDAHWPRWLRWRGNMMTDWDHSDERAVDSITGAMLFLRRRAYEQVGPFDTRFFMYWEETDWLVRARRAGWKLVFTPAVDAMHLDRGSSSADSSLYSALLLDSGYRYVGKHFGVARALTVRLVWIAADLGRLAIALSRGRRRRARVLVGRLLVHVGRPPRSRAERRSGAGEVLAEQRGEGE
jgi:GT2 family glycosyltransferase